MKMDTRRRSRQEVQAMLTAERYQELITYSEETKASLLAGWIEGRSETIRTELRYESALLTYLKRWIRELSPAFYALLHLGALLGTVESLERMQYERSQNMWAKARFEKEPVKHLPEVVLALETHGTMSHTELSEYLSMNASTLTEAMKQILPTGAVLTGRIGRYKLYSLSDAGLRYGKELRRRRRQEAPPREPREKLQQFLEGTGVGERQEIPQPAVPEAPDDGCSLLLRTGDTMRLWNCDRPQEGLMDFQVNAFIRDADGGKASKPVVLGRLQRNMADHATNRKPSRQAV